MPKHTQTASFDIKDLSIISHKCSTCGNLITFDVRTDESHGLPKRCSVCGNALGPAATAIAAYRAFYRAATAPELKLRVHTDPKTE